MPAGFYRNGALACAEEKVEAGSTDVLVRPPGIKSQKVRYGSRPCENEVADTAKSS